MKWCRGDRIGFQIRNRFGKAEGNPISLSVVEWHKYSSNREKKDLGRLSEKKNFMAIKELKQGLQVTGTVTYSLSCVVLSALNKNLLRNTRRCPSFGSPGLWTSFPHSFFCDSRTECKRQLTLASTLPLQKDS